MHLRERHYPLYAIDAEIPKLDVAKESCDMHTDWWSAGIL
jgi:hypothetical protein